MKHINISILLLILSLFCSSQIIYANSQEPKITPDLVDAAIQQKTLIHQVLVSYLQIGQVQNYGNPINIRKTSIINFEKNHSTLKAERSISAELAQTQILWDKLKSIALKQPKKEMAGKLIILNEEIVALSNKIISRLVTKNGNNSASINVSIQQKMLSQRIALFMLMENWEKNGNYTQEMHSSLNQYYKNILFLSNYENNTLKINKSIKLLKKDFTVLMAIPYQEGDEQDYSLPISRYTAQLLRKSKNTARLYIKLKHELSQKAYKTNQQHAKLES